MKLYKELTGIATDDCLKNQILDKQRNHLHVDEILVIRQSNASLNTILHLHRKLFPVAPSSSLSAEERVAFRER